MRVVLDIALTIMIVLEMFIQFTGEFLHEILGFAFFATIIVHVALSSSWIKKAAQSARSGCLGARRAALAAVGCLLAITTIILGVSSIAISGILASAGFTWPFGTYALWVTIHTISAYALCALTVVHLAMHWAFLASVFKVPYDPIRRQAIGTGVNIVAGLGIAALGVAATKETFLQIADAVERPDSPAELEEESLPKGVTDTSSDETASATTDAATSPATPDSKKTRHHSTGDGKFSHKKAKRSQNNSSDSETAQEASSGTANSVSGDGIEGGTDVDLGHNPNSNGESETEKYSQWDSEISSDSYSEKGAESSVSGICTLCRKQCPLSAPRCDKPYQAGLL